MKVRTFFNNVLVRQQQLQHDELTCTHGLAVIQVDLREFWQNDAGEELPSKRGFVCFRQALVVTFARFFVLPGIALNPATWFALKGKFAEVDAAIARLQG